MSSEQLPFPDSAAQPVILVADDDEMIRNVVRAFLQGDGYSVLTAYDGLEALELSRSYNGTIDVLITDVQMPRLNGFGLCSRLLRERPGIKVIFMTGRNESGITFPLLRKPFSGSALSAKVQEVLASSGLLSDGDWFAAEQAGPAHEAAHLVAARALGVSDRSAVPNPDGHLSFHEDWGKKIRDTMDVENLKAYCIVLLAPHFSELKSGSKSELSLEDQVAFEETVEEHFPDLRRVLMARSRRIVEDHYEEIVRLGETLKTYL